MFKTFSLCALLAVASASNPSGETATPTMVPMKEADIAKACEADMETICTTGGASGVALEAGTLMLDGDDLCDTAKVDTI